MPTSDNSFATRNRILASRTLAVFHRDNPTAKEMGAGPLDESTYLVRRTGLMHNIIQPPTNPRIDEAGCGCAAAAPAATCTTGPDAFVIDANLTSTGPFSAPYDSYDAQYTVTWSAVPGATSYSVTSTSDYYASLVVYTSGTSALVYYSGTGDGSVYAESITVNAINDCGTTPSQYDFPPCFLAGTPVTMADGTQKVIEEVAVGDRVLGAFGEVNEVLALHRPLLGKALMCKINGEHSTSNHHPHVAADGGFYANDPATTDNVLSGGLYPVINAAGQKEIRKLLGLRPGRLQQLAVGVALKTVEGSRVVTTIETYSMPPNTQLYNLVVGGSHTYHVDGYAVTGWPREDDFDYDSWKPIVAA